MTKPRPHILDGKLLGYAPSVKRVQALARTARRFVFDDEAARFMGNFVRNCGDVIIHNRQFAIPPLPVTYLEWNSRNYITEIGARATAPLPDSDSRLAYLISGSHVWTLAAGADDATGVALFEYDMNTPSTSQPMFSRKMDEKEMWSRLGLLLGTTLHSLQEDDVAEVEGSNRITLPGRAQLRDPSPEGLHELARHCYGDLRNVWTALLMINQPRHGVTSTHVPHHSGLLRGKRHVYAAHSVVSISLTDREYKRPAQALGFATRESPRRHGVRGHFVHYRGREGCEHAWPVVPMIEEDSVPRWECAHCGRLRVWREAFHRGDATKGFTTNEYELTQ